jgi:hypothetical protein
MELINRYVHQVGRRLPKRLRGDVEEELRSLLMDALEERTGGTAEAFSEDDQAAVLEEFGPPQEMAAKYQPQPKYIIGPKVYQLYLVVAAAIGGAGLVASIVTTAVSIIYGGASEASSLELLGRALELFFGIFLSGIGSATLVFAVLERVIPGNELKLDDDEKWDPRSLPVIEEGKQVKTTNLIVGTAFTALLLVLFLVFPDSIRGFYYDNSGWHSTPAFLSAAFYDLYLPFMATRWGLTIILNLVLLRQRRWQLGTRIADFFLKGFDIFILAWLLVGPSILNAEVMNKMIPAMPDMPFPPVDGALKLAFLVALVVTVITTTLEVYQFVRSRATGALATSDVQ